MSLFLAFGALASAEEEAPYEPPASIAGADFFEPFVSGWESRWLVSKDADFTGKWSHEVYAPDALAGDKGIVVGDEAKRHALSTLFDFPVDPKGKGLVVQYELQLKNTLQCGGAYIKLLTASEELSADGFKADTPYTIMFGPDKCGDTNKVHFILRHKSPVTGEWEEKHLQGTTPPQTTDKRTHLYTAIVGVDNSVKILVDGKETVAGSLLSDTDFKPPVNPPKQIDDPEDKKPADWVDEPKMDDPAASKPDEWDEDAPVQIADPKAEKPAAWLDDAPLKVPDAKASAPADWDEDEDGEWEAPLVDNPDCKAAGCGEWQAPVIANPEYKGKWFAPKVDNPEFIGTWSPRQVDNPGYFVDEEPHAMAPIGGIGIELWTMQSGILFDNILVASDPSVAAAAAALTYEKRSPKEEAVVKSEAREVPREPGFMGAVRHYVTKASWYVQDNVVQVVVALALGLLGLLFYCCFGGKAAEEPEPEESDPLSPADGSADPRQARQAGPSGEGEGEGDEAAEVEAVKEAVEEVVETKKAPKTRKRTAKASD